MGTQAEDNNKPKKSNKKKRTARTDDITIDFEERDPYELNSHVRTQFEEVIGEPDGAHSSPFVWTHVNKAFDVGRNCCFACLTYVCAIPIVFLWGCNFACITFSHIYTITPCFRVFWINCDCASKFFSAFIHCWCDPIYEAVALMFTKIYINIRNSSDVFDERTYAGSELFVAKNRKRMALPKKRYSGRGIEVDRVFDVDERKDMSRHSTISHYSDSFSEDEADPEVYENIQK